MAGEKAKENKKLVAKCAACDKELSVELLTGVVQGTGRGRFIAAVCGPCLDKGWPAIPTESEEPARPAGTTEAPANEASAAEAAAPLHEASAAEAAATSDEAKSPSP